MKFLLSLIFLLHNFYRTALNAGRSSQEKAAHLSVCLSVNCVHCDKMERVDIYYYSIEDVGW